MVSFNIYFIIKITKRINLESYIDQDYKKDISNIIIIKEKLKYIPII